MNTSIPYSAVSCSFDEKRDIQQVEAGLSVDLNQALKTGIVRDSGAPMDSNGIESPEFVVGRVENIFDAIESARAIKKYGKKAPQVASPTGPSDVNVSSTSTPAPAGGE